MDRKKRACEKLRERGCCGRNDPNPLQIIIGYLIVEHAILLWSALEVAISPALNSSGQNLLHVTRLGDCVIEESRSWPPIGRKGGGKGQLITRLPALPFAAFCIRPILQAALSWVVGAYSHYGRTTKKDQDVGEHIIPAKLDEI